MNWRPYLLPALVFQSVIIGGGYATGRELVEFFMPLGPVGGVLGLLVAGIVFAVVTSIAYEFARLHGARDYRHFSRALLGRAWVVYEVAYVALVVLVLAVVGSAAGELLHSVTGLQAALGTLGMMVLVGILTFSGSRGIGNVLAAWSVLLYLLYALLFYETFTLRGDAIAGALAAPQESGNWPLAGLRYASYNVNLPAVLFCMTLLTSRRQALGAGVLTGIIAIVPAVLFFIAMLSQYPRIAEEPVPALALIARLQSPWIAPLFHIVVFGTFVETGAGLLHAINERIDGQARDAGRALPRWARPVIAGTLLVVSVYGATAIGIIDLIARGYGLLSWVFIVVLIIPLLTVGTWRIITGRVDRSRAIPGRSP